MREDIPLYADFFLDQANCELDKRIVGFDPAAAGARPAAKKNFMADILAQARARSRQ